MYRVRGITRVVFQHNARSSRSILPSIRYFSTDPSLESMEAFLSPPSTLRVVEVLGNEFVRVPTTDGLGIGSVVELRTDDISAKGIVVQFDKNFTKIGVLNQINLKQNMGVHLLGSPCFRFHVNNWERFKDSPIERECVGGLPTSGSPVLDFLLGPLLPPGITVAVYGAATSYDIGIVDCDVVRFPSKGNDQTGFRMYVDLINCANEAIAKSKDRKTILLVDLRQFEDVCKSVQLHATLPVSPMALVASVLQLGNGKSLSVIALANSSADFNNELERSADIGVDTSGTDLEGILRIVKRFRANLDHNLVRKMFLEKLIQNHENAKGISLRENEFRMYIDPWEKEARDSLETVMKLVSAVATERRSEIDNLLLMRAMTILHFNKTSKLNYKWIESFPGDLLMRFKTLNGEVYDAVGPDMDEQTLCEVDRCIRRVGLGLELTSYVV